MNQRQSSSFMGALLSPLLSPLCSSLLKPCLVVSALALTCVASPSSLIQRASAELVDRIIAVVGDEVITLSELLQATRPFEAQTRSGVNPLQQERLIREKREEMLEEMINQSLILQLAEEQGLEVTDAEVEAHLQQMMARQGQTSAEFDRQLAMQGVSRETVKSKTREFLLHRKVTQIQLSGKISVTELELRDKYREFASKARGQRRIRGSHLLLAVPPNSTAAQEAAVKQRARELKQRAQRGEDFGALVREFGEGPGKANGGDLGLISRGGGIPRELEDAFFKLDAGQLSPPVRSAYGYHILWAREIVTASIPSFEKLKPQLQRQLSDEKYRQAIGEWIRELRSQMFVERRL